MRSRIHLHLSSTLRRVRLRLRLTRARYLYAAAILLQEVFPDRRPAILVLGDSITRGRLPHLKEMFEPDYAVCAPFENGRGTLFSLTQIETWLRLRKHWDLVVFNWGLHDLRRRDTVPAVSQSEYAKSLTILATRIIAKSDHALFVTTTPVPPKAADWKNDDVDLYNHTAIEIMEELGVPVCDLSLLAAEVHADHGKMPRDSDIHYDREGYRLLAKPVAGAMRAILETSRWDAAD